MYILFTYLHTSDGKYGCVIKIFLKINFKYINKYLKILHFKKDILLSYILQSYIVGVLTSKLS